MSGYATSARIVRASPRLAAFEDARPTLPTSIGPDIGPPIVEERAVERAIAADGGWVRAGERWGRVRDRWSQLVFFVTDPDSWR